METNNPLNADQLQQTVFINHIKEVVFQTDSLCRWAFLNRAWTEITGYEIDLTLGSKMLDYIHPDDRDRFLEFISSLTDHIYKCNRQEFRFLDYKQGMLWLEIYVTPQHNEVEEFVGYAGTLFDNTQRRRMESEIRKKDRLLEAVASATRVLLDVNRFDEAIYQALQILGKVTAVDRVTLFANQPAECKDDELTGIRTEWHRETVSPILDPLELQKLSYTKQFNRWYEVLSQGGIISGAVQDFPENERKFLLARGVVSVLMVPIFLDDSFWGFLSFEDCYFGREWPKLDITILSSAAANIGGAIKRQRTELRLRQNLRDDFRQTIQNLRNLVFKVKRGGLDDYQFTLFEGKLAEELSLNSHRIMNQTLNSSSEFPLLLKERLGISFERAFAGQIESFELAIHDHVLFTTISPIEHDGLITEVVGSAIDITERKQAEEQIRYLAYYDTLIGLPNRSLFEDRLRMAIAQAERSRELIAIMFLDLDRFKNINDTLGHAFGDELLKNVAKRLTLCTRTGDTVSRMYGDEFTLLFTQIKNKDDAESIANKILEAFNEPFILEGRELFITTSIGISLYPYDGLTKESLVKHADTAMYKAKENGKNTYQFFNPDFNDIPMDRISLEKDLRKAIERQEFILHYQPQMDLNSGRMIGTEALVRWQHPIHGIIPPNDFIPLAEETGLIIQIGEWVLRSACQQNKAWQDSGLPPLRVAVNLSLRQFNSANLVERIAEILHESGLDPQYLELEITETVALQHVEQAIEKLNQLKLLGVKVSIDDFGTGYSSLSYLRKFPVNTLKIAQPFIRDMTNDQDDAAIVRAIIAMAHSLKLNVIAEGVESDEQLDSLQRLNCNEVQGYIYSRPVPMEQFEELYRAHYSEE